MTSSDNFVTIEVFEARMDRLESIIDKNMALIDGKLIELKSEIRELKTATLINANNIDHLQHTLYWGFAIMGIVIGIAGLVIAIVGLSRKSERKTDLSERDIRSMIREEIAMAQSAANIPNIQSLR